MCCLPANSSGGSSSLRYCLRLGRYVIHYRYAQLIFSRNSRHKLKANYHTKWLSKSYFHIEEEGRVVLPIMHFVSIDRKIRVVDLIMCDGC